MPDDLQSQFEQASLDITRLGHRPDNDTLLRIYALYKQGAEGDVHGDKPGFFDFVGTAKYEAWATLRGTTREQAMRDYIALVRALGASGFV
ncbi:acyl-CoA-binding protein [Luteibacter yeojuensis]|uniref:Acyl-CoA-binding protein n=1 Tax=Luteibacter yeojuensis TaxID=345309 RepID=A0A0F3KPQ3_9GAMM|nr:acyl-CoA-binding protein [Luteibacter yeojuensis]KJV33141.1 acyl-CoA-binding protein [Luteibacter yeojuensis]